MRRFFLLTLLLPAVAIQAQPNKPVPKVIEHLLSLRGDKPVRVAGSLNFFLPDSVLPAPLRGERQYFLSTDAGLLVKVNGTGVLVRVEERGGGLAFTRMDSTFFWGSDFEALLFSRGDTIYSFGGYGFWRNNGMLRLFDHLAHGWVVRPLDREVEADCTMGGYWFDGKAGHLYVTHRYPLSDGLIGQAEREVPADSSVWRLDLASRSWTRLGGMTDRMPPGLNSPWGNLTALSSKSLDFQVCDFVHNRRMVFSSGLHQRFEASYSLVKPTLFYFVDSTLFIGNPALDKFDSIPMRSADLIETGEPVYGPVKDVSDEPLSSKAAAILGLLIGILGTTLFQYLRSMKKKTPRSPSAGEPMDADNVPTDPDGASARHQAREFAAVFTPMELELIRLVRDRTLAGRTANIDEVNHVLGLAAKNESVQKKNRSDVITSINQKWMLMQGVDEPLIQRKRSEFDGRFFEYFLDLARVESIKDLI